MHSREDKDIVSRKPSNRMFSSGYAEMEFTDKLDGSVLRILFRSAALLVILLPFSLIRAPRISMSYAETTQTTRVFGHVFDFETKQPMAKAQIDWSLGEQQQIVGDEVYRAY